MPLRNSMHYNDTSTQIANERPWTTPGYAIASNEFIASDVGLLPDWYSRLEIRFGAKSYPAAVVGHYPERRCVLIRTEQPVPGIRPLQFQPEWKGKLFAFFTADEDGVRLAGTIPLLADPDRTADFHRKRVAEDSAKLPPGHPRRHPWSPCR